MPASRSAGVSPLRRRACACSLSAVSGERSSCAASATKCFCASKAPRTRPNSRLSSSTSGRTSSGRPSLASGDKSSARRPATWRRARSMGASERLMTHHTASISSGVSSSKGQHGAQGQRPRAGRARVQVLGDLHGLQRGLQGVDAVAVAVRLDVRETQHRARRQRRARGAEDLRAVLAPDLHIHLETVVDVGFIERQVERHAAAQRARHLLQVVVEHRIGLPQRAAVGGAGLQHGGAEDGGEYKPQQSLRCRECGSPAEARDFHSHCLGTR
jgi:hypothetical protein